MTRRLIRAMTLIISLILASGCASREALQMRSLGQSCQVVIEAPEAIGRIRLWVPEAIASDKGLSAVYPKGHPWKAHRHKLDHEVPATGILGAGNCPLVDKRHFECAGIRIPRDSEVRWKTEVEAKSDRVDFEIELTNVGKRTIRKAGAAICIKFLNGSWWSSERTYVLSNGEVRSLAELGWDAGQPNGFQAWVLDGESCGNVFYQKFWGFNRHRLSKPMMVSQHPDAGLCVVVEADAAYFLHCNKGNPCTDMMLAFGDVKPGETAEASGRIRIVSGTAADWLRHAYR